MKTKTLFFIKKLITFFVLYAIAALLGEGIIIGGFTIAGYDILHGEMPTAEWVNALPMYGTVLFIIVTLIYLKKFEKKSFHDIYLTFSKSSLLLTLKWLLIGIFLPILTSLLLCVFGVYQFKGFGSIQLSSFAIYLPAFLIQACSEETMCRGFMQNSLKDRLSLTLAVLGSMIVFIAPHVTSFSEFCLTDFLIIFSNLALVSVLFSFTMLNTRSLPAACALHFGWNFCLYSILGLNLTGIEATGNSGLLNFKVVSNSSMLTGGSYGIEASIYLVPILLIIDFIMVVHYDRRNKKTKLTFD